MVGNPVFLPFAQLNTIARHEIVGFAASQNSRTSLDHKVDHGELSYLVFFQGAPRFHLCAQNLQRIPLIDHANANASMLTGAQRFFPPEYLQRTAAGILLGLHRPFPIGSKSNPIGSKSKKKTK